MVASRSSPWGIRRVDRGKVAMIQETRVEYAAAGRCDRQIVSVEVPSFDILSSEIADVALPSPHFVGLVCSDARGVSDRAIIDTATALLDQGLVYLCTWGPDCNRVRNLFESTALVWNPRVVLLAVHFYEALDDAVDYVLNVASPSMHYTETCQTSLIVTVGSAAWSKHIRQQLGTLDDVQQSVS